MAAAQAPAIRQLETQARAFREADKKRDQYEQTAKQQAGRIATLEERVRLQDTELKELRNFATTVREGVPLEKAVAFFEPEELTEAELSIGKDAQGRHRVYRAGKVVGRNAIDLVEHATGLKGRDAIAWLSDREGGKVATAVAVNHAFEQSLQESVQAERTVEEPAFREASFARVLRQAHGRPAAATMNMLKRHRFEIRDVAPAWGNPTALGNLTQASQWGFDARLNKPMRLTGALIASFTNFLSVLQIQQAAAKAKARAAEEARRHGGIRRR